MQSKKCLALAIALSVLTTGCATSNASPNVYRTGETMQAGTAEPVTVTRVRPIAIVDGGGIHSALCRNWWALALLRCLPMGRLGTATADLRLPHLPRRSGQLRPNRCLKPRRDVLDSKSSPAPTAGAA